MNFILQITQGWMLCPGPHPCCFFIINITTNSIKKVEYRGFPFGPVIKNSACQFRRHGFNP